MHIQLKNAISKIDFSNQKMNFHEKQYYLPIINIKSQYFRCGKSEATIFHFNHKQSCNKSRNEIEANHSVDISFILQVIINKHFMEMLTIYY